MNEPSQYRSWVEIDLDAFRQNWKEIRRLTGGRTRVLQVVKADAYGHGAIEISQHALKNGAAFLGVANADEGVQLRVGGITAPILILSPSPLSEIDEIIKYNLRPSVSDREFASALDATLEKRGMTLPVHLEVDTGMGRGGMLYTEALESIRAIRSLPHLEIEGVFSHMASSEVRDEPYNATQWERFSGLLADLEREGPPISLRHFSNSGGVLNFPRYGLDMVRPGIMTYGIYPSPALSDAARLCPVMSFKTTIVLVKAFPPGYSIGYNRTFITSRDTRIATIPVGYGDGYGLILSNSGEALVRGKRVPIVGRVSMDMCTLDVTDVPECRTGDEVVLLGKQGGAYLSANEIAAKAGTISYEVLCALGKRAPRVFVNKGKPDSVEPRLRRVFIPEEERSIARIDQIIRSCLEARASDRELGNAIYYEMLETLFGKENRQLELRSGFDYRIRVREFTEAEKREDPDGDLFFQVTTEVGYTKILKNRIFFIGCAMTNEQLSALFEDSACEYRWLFNTRKEQIREEDFRVRRVRIDGSDVPILRVDHTKRGLEVWCGGDLMEKHLDRPVRFEIEIVTKKLKSNRLFSVYLVYPTRGFNISFDYEGTALRNVREVSFFSGKHLAPEVREDRGKSISLTLGENDWIFPTSGVTFVWDL